MDHVWKFNEQWEVGDCRSVGKSARGGDEVNQLHLSVSAEPEPRFVF
jgi:hypothetical protein